MKINTWRLFGIIGLIFMFVTVVTFAAGAARGTEPQEEITTEELAPAPTPHVEPSPEPSVELTPEPSIEPTPKPTIGAAPAPEPTPEISASEKPLETPGPQPQVPQWKIGDAPADTPPVRVETPVGYSPENQIPIADQNGDIKGPGAYLVISEGVLLGNYIFDPVASRQLLEMMRSPECDLGPFCGAIIAPSNGNINPGTPIIP